MEKAVVMATASAAVDAAVATVSAAVDAAGSANGYGTAETHASSAESEGDRQGEQEGEHLGRGGSDCADPCRYGTRESRGRCLWDTSIIEGFLGRDPRASPPARRDAGASSR